MNKKYAQSWLPVAANSDFPLQNIPFGIAQLDEKTPFVASIIGDTVLNLAFLANENYFTDSIAETEKSVFNSPSLNAFIALGKEKTNAVRKRVMELFEEGNSTLADVDKHLFLHQAADVKLLLPIEIGDYTDFYSSRQHATNVGIMFRDPANALLPNWLHLPVGYHGRASSVMVSGTPIRRPMGQRKPADADAPVFGASQQLDFELETAFVIGKNTGLGDRITTADAPDYIFGMALFNDWSARDIQAWEYVPLGPFLGKNFGSSLSPWIVTMEALEQFKTEGEKQVPAVLPYLEFEGNHHYDIELSVKIIAPDATETEISRSNFKYMYWNIVQQLAHHTVNGCNVRVGDLMASGTISGNTPESYGSMLELSWRGTKPLTLSNGTERKFLNDGDTLVIQGWGEKDGLRIGFGEVRGELLPAK